MKCSPKAEILRIIKEQGGPERVQVTKWFQSGGGPWYLEVAQDFGQGPNLCRVPHSFARWFHLEWRDQQAINCATYTVRANPSKD